MTNYDTMRETLKKALVLKRKMDRIKQEVLADLEEQHKAITEKLLREMKDCGIFELDDEDGFGKVNVVLRRGQIKINQEALLKDLGWSSLDKYQVEGKSAEFLKYTLKK